MLNNRLSKLFVTAALAIALVVASFAAASAGPDAKAAAASNIKWSEAKSIFKEELPSKAVIKYLHLTKDDGIKVYKGKAVKGKYVYSIEINAKNGKIMDRDKDNEGSRYTASKVGAVSKATIKSKIKDRVPGAIIIYVKLTRDDGRYVYEAEAYKDGYEYDFEYTKGGRLIEYERDRV